MMVDAVGGAQGLLVDADVKPSDVMTLTYNVRFPSGFDFVKGGKLPGLYGRYCELGW